MKTFLAAVAMTVLLAVGAAFVLDNNFEQTSLDAFTTTGARL